MLNSFHKIVKSNCRFFKLAWKLCQNAAYFYLFGAKIVQTRYSTKQTHLFCISIVWPLLLFETKIIIFIEYKEI